MATTSAGNTRRHSGVQVLTRAIDILRALAVAPTGLTLAELATRVGLPRSTVYRIVVTLAEEGFVIAPGSSGGLRLGPELARLASSTSADFVQVARPFMEELAHKVGETTDLAVLSDGRVRFVAQVAAGRRLRADTVVGELFPAHCTANGKALLAELPPRTLETMLPSRLKRFTKKTIVSRSELIAELERVRRERIAYDLEEHTERICAVGATVRDALAVLGAVTVAAPAERFYGRERELASALLETTERISTALGWQPAS